MKKSRYSKHSYLEDGELYLTLSPVFGITRRNQDILNIPIWKMENYISHYLLCLELHEEIKIFSKFLFGRWRITSQVSSKFIILG